MPVVKENIPLANFLIDLKDLGDCKIKFAAENEEGESFGIELEHRFYVADFDMPLQEIPPFPNILGRDFLVENNVSLHYEDDGSNYLEIEMTD